jgi:hypothetical protein
MIEGGEGVGGDGAAAGDGAGVGDGGIGDVGGGNGGSSGGGTSDVTPSEYGNGVPTPTSIQGTANGVTAALNSDGSSVTVYNADGSQTTLYPDSPGYSEALDAAVSGSGSVDETAHGATNPLDDGSTGGTTATAPTNEPVSPPATTSTNEPTSGSTGSSESPSNATGGSTTGNSSSQLEMTNTVINNNKIVSKSVDPNAIQVGMSIGRMSRPYVQSPATQWLVENIMAGGEPQADKWLANGLRWDVQGFMNQSVGKWELAIDQDTNRIVHFLFSRDKTP